MVCMCVSLLKTKGNCSFFNLQIELKSDHFAGKSRRLFGIDFFVENCNQVHLTKWPIPA